MKKKIVFIIVGVIVAMAVVTYTLYKTNNNRIGITADYYGIGEFIETTSEELLKKSDQNYVLFVYNNYCTFKIPCDEIFLSYMKNNKINFLSMTFEEFKKTTFYSEVKYAPSIIVVKNNKIIAYLDAEKDDDILKYQDVDEFSKWINKYINGVTK